MDDAAVDVAKNSLEQVSILNPILALLLIFLFVVVVVLAYAVIKQNKKLNETNLQLYKNAKEDLLTTVAFGDKIGDLTKSVEDLCRECRDLKSEMGAFKSLVEVLLKKQ